MAPSPPVKYEAAPKSLHYEFGGPLGALGVVISVPFFSYCAHPPSSSSSSPSPHNKGSPSNGSHRAALRRSG